MTAYMSKLRKKTVGHGATVEKTKVGTSLAGHTLHLRRKGLVSCLYATCASCYITVGNAYVMDNEYD